MRKHLTKYIIIPGAIIVSALIILISGAALLVYFYPEESVLNMIRSKVEDSLDRKVEINSLKYSIRGVLLNGVTVWDKDLSGEQSKTAILKSDEVIISYSILSILKKEYKINTLYLRKLSVRLAYDNTGKSNFGKLLEEIKNKASLSSGESKASFKISEIILTDCSLNLVNPPSDYKPLEGSYTINSQIKVENDKKLHLSETGVKLPSDRGILYPDIEIDLTDKLKITGIVKLKNCSMNWLYSFKLKPLQLPFETVSGIVDNFVMSLPYFKGHANATSTLKNSKSILRAEGSCIVDIDKSTVVIKDVDSRINNSSAHLENLSIDYGLGTIPRFNVPDFNHSLSDLRALAPEIPSGFAGNLKGSVSYNGSKYNGKIRISDCSYRDRTEIFSGLNTELEIKDNIFRKEEIPVKLFGSNFNVSIAATDNNFQRIYVFMKGDKLDLNKISLSSGKSSADFYFPIDISGKILIGEMIYDTLVFRNNQADFAAAEKTIKINRLDTSVFSGTLSGSGKIDLAGDFPSAHINAKFNNMKIHEVKFKEENLNNRLFGFADGTANLGFSFKENMTDTIHGNTTFSVTKGKVVNTGIQDGLIIFLAELRYKLKDLEFSKIYGNIDINGKDFMINSFIFNSEDLRLSMNGRLDSSFNANNMTMKLEFNNHFIKDIPRPAIAVFNEYLSGRWYIIPFSLNGNITNSKNIKMLKKNQ